MTDKFPQRIGMPFGLRKSLKVRESNCQMEAAHWHGCCASSKTIRSPDNRAGSHSRGWQPETARHETQRTVAEAETQGKLSRACILDQRQKSSVFILNPTEQLCRVKTPDVNMLSSFCGFKPSVLTCAWFGPSFCFGGWKEGSSEGRTNTWLRVLGRNLPFLTSQTA